MKQKKWLVIGCPLDVHANTFYKSEKCALNLKETWLIFLYVQFILQRASNLCQNEQGVFLVWTDVIEPPEIR